MGVPPLYNLARRLLAEGREVTVVLGFNTQEEIFYADEFAALGARVIVATADGSRGVKGFVTDAIRSERPAYDYVYACGPMPMLRALGGAIGDVPGQFSFEERMGCGLRRLHGLHLQDQGGQQAHLPRGARTEDGRDNLGIR